MTWLEDGLPSSLRPGRRPRTTLSPSLALRHGEPHQGCRTRGAGGLVVESRLGAATLDDLRRRGHDVVDAGEWALGRMCAVGRGKGPAVACRAADTRSGTGAAATF